MCRQNGHAKKSKLLRDMQQLFYMENRRLAAAIDRLEEQDE